MQHRQITIEVSIRSAGKDRYDFGTVEATSELSVSEPLFEASVVSRAVTSLIRDLLDQPTPDPEADATLPELASVAG